MDYGRLTERAFERLYVRVRCERQHRLMTLSSKRLRTIPPHGINVGSTPAGVSMELQSSSNVNPDATKPHRVIFRAFGTGKVTSKIFSNRCLADNFAISKEVRELLLIQLATERAPSFKQSSELFNRILCKVPCEKCSGKNKRLRSEAECSECSGANYRIENGVRGYK